MSSPSETRYTEETVTAATLLLLLSFILRCSSGLSWVISPQVFQELGGGGGFEKLHNSLIYRVLILLQPAGNIVVDNSCVVRDSKVSIFVSFGCWLQEHWQLS